MQYRRKKTTVCKIYIPPITPRHEIDLENLIQQRPKPFLFMGDFNAHNQHWGSKDRDTRGKYIEKVVENEFIILNDGPPTHFCARTGQLPSIGLTICEPSIAHKIDWKTLPHLYGNDHFPILISIPRENQQVNNVHKIQWKHDQGDWKLFKTLTKITDANFTDINAAVENITNKIIEAANQTIPKKKNKITRSVPWWNDKCQEPVRERKRALYKFRKNNNEEKPN